MDVPRVRAAPGSRARSGARARRAGRGGGGGGGGRGGGTGFRGSQATPIVVDGIMYMPTPYNRVIALEAHTGKEVWIYKSPGAVTNRGVEYWPGDGTAPPMILFVSGGFLVGLDARTGVPVPTFGNNGMVDFRQGITNGFPNGQYQPVVAAEGLQEPRHHRRARAGIAVARLCRRHARLGFADRQAGLAVPPRAAAGRARP